ncbi:MAG: SDR family NAD(P)-dependent oxidoreductase [Limnochordia bacterium]|jgi:3-oxoacyl-[acyl-carrier protein] reductase
MYSLAGKIALVTGASRGLGAGIARALASAGADVVVNYLSSQARAEEVAAEIRQMGRRCLVIQADAAEEEAVAGLFSAIRDAFGRLDILVNNAGTTRAEDIFCTALDSWEFIIRNNLTSTFLCSKYAMGMMKEQKGGRIINISSIVAQRGALFGHVHYAATKSGQLGLAKTLARTAAPYGITVNSIAPGIIETELLIQTHGPEEVAALAETVPLGLGNVKDVGFATVFLASDEARYITGATIDVNGGMHMC